MKWMTKPVTMPLWWHLIAVYFVLKALSDSDITQGFIAGLTGG